MQKENYQLKDGNGNEITYNEIPCVRLSNYTEEQKKAYILAHNKLTMNTDFDIDILNEELDDILNIDMSDFGFEIGIDEKDQDIVEDEVPEVPEEAIAKPGDIYQLGEHRLMCGDSTREEDVRKLTEGNTIDLLFTDPPYNVDVSNSQGMKIANDNMSDSDFYEFLNKAFKCATNELKKGGAFYIWFADSEDLNFRNACFNNDLIIKQCLIWVKNSFNFGRQDYKWQHEPCLYGWKDGDSHYFVEEYNHSTVIEDELDFDKMKKEEMKALLEEIFSNKLAKSIIRENKPLKNDLHPTMKPLKMCAELIRHSTRKGENVLDLFGGSGSTLITCEQIERKCYMMEYDPHYVDVIIERWENFTGQKAVKING